MTYDVLHKTDGESIIKLLRNGMLIGDMHHETIGHIKLFGDSVEEILGKMERIKGMDWSGYMNAGCYPKHEMDLLQ